MDVQRLWEAANAAAGLGRADEAAEKIKNPTSISPLPRFLVILIFNTDQKRLGFQPERVSKTTSFSP